MELLDERLSAFHTEVAAMIGSRTLTFREFRACGSPDYHGARTLLLAEYVSNAFSTGTCPEGDKVQLASCLLKDMAQDWWEEVTQVVGTAAMAVMTWEDFV